MRSGDPQAGRRLAARVLHSGPAGHPEEPATPSNTRPSLLAGVATLLAAALVIALVAVLDPADAAPAAAEPTPTVTAAPGLVAVRVRFTANVHALPDRGSQVVAIFPGGATTAADARTEKGEWLRVAYPPADSARGWVHASALEADSEAVAALPSAAVPVGTPVAGRPVVPLPDLAIEQVSLLPGNVVSLVLRNAGSVSLTSASVTLRVMNPYGELLSVLRIGPTTLPAQGNATVVTPLTVVERGAYRLELDPENDIPEVDDGNNSYLAVLEPPPAPPPPPSPTPAR